MPLLKLNEVVESALQDPGWPWAELLGAVTSSVQKPRPVNQIYAVENTQKGGMRPSLFAAVASELWEGTS